MTNMRIKLLQSKLGRSAPCSVPGTCSLTVPGAVVALTMKRAMEAKRG